MSLFPVACVSCNKAIGGRLRQYERGVARYARQGHRARFLVASSTRAEEVRRLFWAEGDAGADTRTAEGRALDELGVVRECCRRHFLSYTDFHDIRRGTRPAAPPVVCPPAAPAPSGPAPPAPEERRSVVTLTFCERGENHVGMEPVRAGAAGEVAGYTVADLLRAKAVAEGRLGLRTRLVRLHEAADGLPEAAVLVIEGFVAPARAARTLAEALALQWDRQFYSARHSKVLNKHARANLMFADREQPPDYERRKGRIVNFARVPGVAALRARIGGLGTPFAGLIAEGNLYDDGGAKKTGIGFHGDTERTRVVGVRLGPPGESMPLHFQWHNARKPVGERIVIPLRNGDAYVMSAKAVGTDWKRWSIPTLRHATGAPKFVNPKPKPRKTKKTKKTKKKKKRTSDATAD